MYIYNVLWSGQNQPWASWHIRQCPWHHKPRSQGLVCCRRDNDRPTSEKARVEKWATFHYTGWLIGILIMVYYNPYIYNWVVWSHIQPKRPGCFSLLKWTSAAELVKIADENRCWKQRSWQKKHSQIPPASKVYRPLMGLGMPQCVHINIQYFLSHMI